MTERPILMHDRSVRAILEGRKTQTRRPIRDVPNGTKGFLACTEVEDGGRAYAVPVDGLDIKHLCDPVYCPYGGVGDRLWVREAHAYEVISQDKSLALVSFRVDSDRQGLREFGIPEDYDGVLEETPAKRDHWRPSIHMPRWAARILLRVEDIRVEQVQETSDKDARAEGVRLEGYDPQQAVHQGQFLRSQFRENWDETYSDKPQYQWEENPWVWVVEFSVEEGSG